MLPPTLHSPPHHAQHLPTPPRAPRQAGSGLTGAPWGSEATSASNRLSKKFTKCICKGKSKALLVSHHLPALKRSPLPCASAAPNAPTSCRQAQGIPAWQGTALPAAPTKQISKTVIEKQFLQLWHAATRTNAHPREPAAPGAVCSVGTAAAGCLPAMGLTPGCASQEGAQH